TLTNIRISVTLPNSYWELEHIKPELISSLKPGESYPVSIKINVPSDAYPSEYKVTIDVKADQTETAERITFVVQEKGYGTLVGIAIITASLFVIYLLIKKFGRR
ncbi:MAG: NEW3 domain-containing protein, partial [Archaeoglobaceae archaeon]